MIGGYLFRNHELGSFSVRAWRVSSLWLMTMREYELNKIGFICSSGEGFFKKYNIFLERRGGVDIITIYYSQKVL